jgi:hypothetical protein
MEFNLHYLMRVHCVNVKYGHKFIFSVVLLPGEASLSAFQELRWYCETVSGVVPLVVSDSAPFVGMQ